MANCIPFLELQWPMVKISCRSPTGMSRRKSPYAVMRNIKFKLHTTSNSQLAYGWPDTSFPTSTPFVDGRRCGDLENANDVSKLEVGRDCHFGPVRPSRHCFVQQKSAQKSG